MPVSRRRRPHRQAVSHTRVARQGRNPEVLADRWARVAATVIDNVVLPTLCLWISIRVVQAITHSDPFERPAWVIGPMMAIMVVNHIVGIALRGQTIGKHLLGIRVVRADTFDVPGWRRSILRSFGLSPLGFIPYGGQASGIADDASFLLSNRRRAFHDYISGTIVVDDGPWRRWIEGQRARAPEAR